jgi:hypothetical protein
MLIIAPDPDVDSPMMLLWPDPVCEPVEPEVLPDTLAAQTVPFIPMINITTNTIAMAVFPFMKIAQGSCPSKSIIIFDAAGSGIG